jgi:hypothetical protein
MLAITIDLALSSLVLSKGRSLTNSNKVAIIIDIIKFILLKKCLLQVALKKIKQSTLH